MALSLSLCLPVSPLPPFLTCFPTMSFARIESATQLLSNDAYRAAFEEHEDPAFQHCHQIVH